MVAKLSEYEAISKHGQSAGGGRKKWRQLRGEATKVGETGVCISADREGGTADISGVGE